jgi:hypothetical protein
MSEKASFHANTVRFISNARDRTQVHHECEPPVILLVEVNTAYRHGSDDACFIMVARSNRPMIRPIASPSVLGVPLEIRHVIYSNPYARARSRAASQDHQETRAVSKRRRDYEIGLRARHITAKSLSWQVARNQFAI